MFGIYIILFLAVLFCLALTFYSFFIGAPIFFTPKKALRDALKYCNSAQNTKFYDLGAGTGRAMVVAGKEFGLRSYGFELSPIFFLIAKLNIFLFGKKNSKLFCQNFYNYNLKDADIVFCFLKPSAMEKLKVKFSQELNPGVRIVSYSFQIPEWKPEKIIRNNYPGRIYIYKI